MKHMFQIDGERLRCRGVDFGYGNSDPWLIARGKHHAVIRGPGTHDWSGIGASSYYPAKWYLVRAEVTPKTLRVTEVIREEEPGRGWRRTKTRFVAEMKQLEEEKTS